MNYILGCSIYVALGVLLGCVCVWLVEQFFPRGSNTARTSAKTITHQMNELRPLPMGQKQFVEWSDRIISGALIPTDDTECLRGILASMIMSLGPTEDHKPDAYFIHSLRKAAANEVAHSNFQAIKAAKKPKEGLA